MYLPIFEEQFLISKSKHRENASFNLFQKTLYKNKNSISKFKTQKRKQKVTLSYRFTQFHEISVTSKSPFIFISLSNFNLII